MGLFNFFGNTNAPQPKAAVELSASHNELKNKLMNSLTTNLSAHNFTKTEIQEVFNIIEEAEANINKLKEALLQIKNSNVNPTAAVLKIKKEVELIQQKMAADIKIKVRQIKLRKQKTKKESL
ncbi:hypothetical protein IJG14_02510 [bacterium]|nr:hypothetical protein [bacterium]